MDDQTDPNDLAAAKPDELGTGVFLYLQDPASTQGLTRKEFVLKVTHSYCVQRGADALAFRWVPHSVMAELQVLTSSCSGACKRTCVTKGCVCNVNRQVCE